MLYSANTGGFYDPTITPTPVIPSDVVEIDDDCYAELLSGQSAGKRIAADTGGLPVLLDPPPPTVADQLLARITVLRDACGDVCEGGYESDAVGALHTYPTDGPYNQINMLGHHDDAVDNIGVVGWTQDITCTPVGGVTSTRVVHTAGQSKAVAAGVKEMIAAARKRYNNKKQYLLGLDLNSTTIADQIAAVTWESEE